MEGAMPNTPLDREEDKKEIFARVWKRVMGDHTDACPITWEETGGDQAQTTTEQQQTLVTEETAQTEEKTGCSRPPMFPGAASGSTATFPGRCPGGFGAPVSGLRAAAPGVDPPGAGRLPGVPDPLPPAGGGPARVLAGLAGEKKRRAKRLSAAYFLISGVRYWPEGEKCPPVTSYLGTLRRRFAQEQATMAAYLTGTETTTDPCLQQLFWEHAREAWDQACKIRTLVEQA